MEFATKKVAYGDLNLESDLGAKAFLTRVQSAAKSVCASLEEQHISVTHRYETCLDSAVSNAVAQVNNSKVNAMYLHGAAQPMKLVASR